MKRLAVLSFATVSAASFGQVWSGGGGAIPDGTNATSTPGAISTTIAVPELLSVSSITISGLAHTWAGDLAATVTAPGGASFDLFIRPGRAAAQSFGTPFGTFNDFTGGIYTFVASGGTNLWTTFAGGNAGTGSYDASTANGGGAASGLFPGGYGAGDWTLTVSDWAESDTGSFNSWEIRGEMVPEPATMAILGLGAAALIRRRRK